MQCLTEQLQAITDSDDFQQLRKSIDCDNLHELFEWKDGAGNCLFHLCIASSRLDCWDELLLLLSRLSLDVKKHVNGTNHYGRTPLHLAAFYGSDSAMESLLNLQGIEIDQQTNAGCTPLYFACSRSHTSIVNRLLTSGANPNVQTRASSTPLIAATVIDNQAVVKALLEKGACSDVQNSEGKTALHVAAETNNEEIMNLLIMYGADSSIVDQNGNAPNEVLAAAQERIAVSASIALQSRCTTPQVKHSPHMRHGRMCKTDPSSTAGSPNVASTRQTPNVSQQPSTASHSVAMSSPISPQMRDPTLGRLCEALHTIDNARQSCSRNGVATIATNGSLYHKESACPSQ